MSDFLTRLHDSDSPPSLMGILNLTTDSFSDGGDFISPEIAIAHAEQMVRDGARIIDVGAESTRPGAEPVPDAEQIRRVVPVIEALRANFGADIEISIDARRAGVAQAALEAGASIINDVEAGRDDGMLELAARFDSPIVLMHMQGKPQTMQDNPHYGDVVAEVKAFLLERAAQAEAVGVAKSRIIIDPGIGFGKSRKHNLLIMRHLAAYTETGYPVLLGTSRKRFMGAICQETVFKELLGATCATTVLGAQAGVRIFRVHDVRDNRQALELALAIRDIEED